ncbi:MAG TPA: hypothetical protein VGB02_15340 [Pyrinomonadaceae bacterium]|jgi:hypothetical protein
MFSDEFWLNFKVSLVTVVVTVLIVVWIFGFTYQRDKRRGQLKLGELVTNFLRILGQR